MKSVVLIRDRGQLTIPDNIRKAVSWITPMSAISISVLRADEIVLRPHRQKNDADWNQLWTQIKRVRAFKGKGQGNLSGFIAQDRESRK